MTKTLKSIALLLASVALLFGAAGAATADQGSPGQTVVLHSDTSSVVGPTFKPDGSGFTLEEDLLNTNNHFVAHNSIDCTFTGNFTPEGIPEAHCIATVIAINGSYQLEATFFLFTPQTYTATYVEGSATGAYVNHHPVSATVEDRAPGDETYTLQF